MIVALAGGVGGARLAAGLAAALGDPADLTVIVNTGDDFEHLGLSISPDLDTVMYTLAGIENPEAGWGRRDETWSFMATLEMLGGPAWFRLGDNDMAVHVARTEQLRAGRTLSQVTSDLSRALGIRPQILPMSDDPFRTIVSTDEGELEFQHYFVRRRCEPSLRDIRFQGMDTADVSKAALAALEDETLEAIVIAPSNPYVSIAPILAVKGMRQALERRPVPLVAVSPIIAGRAVKGPAAKMMSERGVEVSALGIARHYTDLIDGLVIDEADRDLAPAIASLGVSVHVTSTLMRDDESRRRLAVETLGFSRRLGAG